MINTITAIVAANKNGKPNAVNKKPRRRTCRPYS
jgi:hypothetical protein